MILANQKYTEILVTHNGYLYLLVKTGLIGFLAYFSFIFLSVHNSYKIYKSSNNLYLKIIAKLSLALVLTISISTIVVSGFISKSNASIVLIILGYISAYKINAESHNSFVT